MIRPKKNRAVITGLGILAANGTGKDEFWRTLLAGESGVGPITLFDASDLACRIAGEVKGFDAEDYIDSSLKPKRMGRFAQFAVATGRMALANARIDRSDLARTSELPIVMGVSTSALDVLTVAPRLHTAVASVPHSAASAIAYGLDVTARILTISNGCASSLDAVAVASELVRNGSTDLAIAGGSDASITSYLIESMLKCRRCSTSTDPKRASRPFDLNRNFGVLAEGAGVVVIENLEHAQARGADIYAQISGYGSCADPPGSEEGGGFALAMERAMAAASMGIRDIDYVNAHGPSDIQMDTTETKMIKQVLKDHAYNIPVTSIKGNTGCALAVGGVHQIIATALMIKHRMVPPTANYETPDPKCDLDYVPRMPRRCHIRNALVNTHGFGRGNSSVILTEVV